MRSQERQQARALQRPVQYGVRSFTRSEKNGASWVKNGSQKKCFVSRNTAGKPGVVLRAVDSHSKNKEQTGACLGQSGKQAMPTFDNAIETGRTIGRDQKDEDRRR